MAESWGRRRAAIQLSCCVLVVGCTLSSVAQVIAPAVRAAVTVDQALQAMAVKPEPSGYLLLDLPDIAPAGPLQVRMRSEISGTGWLVLLRGKRGQTPRLQAPGAAQPEPVLIQAIPIKGGQIASAEVSMDFKKGGFYTLLAYARGRWYVTEREVKLAKPGSGAAKDPAQTSQGLH